jgi:hypothetical protein
MEKVFGENLALRRVVRMVPVPEGQNDRSQAIYCLVFARKPETVP